ncbi:MAG TPA: ADP-ribosylglycohydrolase family protein [Anaerolineales bacterium]|nr:ADP-ribosylglycohydrolase family protein [Anaerolineales bacterium]
MEKLEIKRPALPHDYPERVYAGVLGKMIGVYLGRPVEGWTYDRIMERLGEIRCYVHEPLNVPLVVTDDDLAGTFTFIRAMEDYGRSPDLTPAQIGHTWLNYLVENRTVLWWGGLGNSTEHTAYLRLKSGIDAPRSGSMAMNGKVVSEQIGAQIFADGWGMISPGEPELAADLARRAASVSHDGEAIYAAQVIAAMEALAFVEPNIDALLDAAVALIPPGSVIAEMIAAIRGWHAAQPDWRAARRRLAAVYGYDRFGGNVHVVPNHGLIILALLYGAGDFCESLAIATTSGWDTDCNAGNLGCLLGIRNGLAGFEGGPDWRGPVGDRLYLPTADGGRAITDAVAETYRLVNNARALWDLPPLAPKTALATISNSRGPSRASGPSLKTRRKSISGSKTSRVTAGRDPGHWPSTFPTGMRAGHSGSRRRPSIPRERYTSISPGAVILCSPARRSIPARSCASGFRPRRITPHRSKSGRRFASTIGKTISRRSPGIQLSCSPGNMPVSPGGFRTWAVTRSPSPGCRSGRWHPARRRSTWIT